MTYAQKLRKTSWQRKSHEIISRDNYTCQKCGDKSREKQVHHIEYLGDIEPEDYPNDMLVTLCIVCHAAENKREKWETNLLRSLKMKGFFAYEIQHLATKIYRDNNLVAYLKSLLR